MACFLNVPFMQKKFLIFKVKSFENYGTWVLKIGQLSFRKLSLDLRPTFGNYSQFIIAKNVELVEATVNPF